MIDFHTHCLPGIDDGAADTDEALALLEDTVRQGIYTVAATPHFYRGERTVSEFLARRDEALAALKAVSAERPELAPLRFLTGAEVLLREGISREDLRPLCLQGTDILLVELPFMAAPYWLTDELEEIVLGQRLTVMFAHVNRYRAWYSTDKIRNLLELPDVIVQLNGEAFDDGAGYRHLRHWLPEPERLVFGSDMHHPKERPQNLQAAEKRMSRDRAGRAWLQLSAACEKEILNNVRV